MKGRERNMGNKALMVIDIQNDITKNYKKIIDRINQAVDFLFQEIILTQGSNPLSCASPALQADSIQLNHQERHLVGCGKNSPTTAFERGLWQTQPYPEENQRW